jgi:hypothetical protein
MQTTRHDSTEVRRLLEVRQSEHLTFQQLSERSGVPVHVLTYRAAQDRQGGEKRRSEHGAFVEVVAGVREDEPTRPANSAGIEVHLPGGLCVRLDRCFDETALARLLSIVRC